MAISIPIKENKCELKNLELIQDEKTKKYYLSAVFRIEDKFTIKELTVPRIALDIKDSPIINETTEPLPGQSWYPYYKAMYIDMGFGSLRLESATVKGYAGNMYYLMKTIEEKTQELTLSEIEKKLGYKIKLVSEKEKH